MIFACIPKMKRIILLLFAPIPEKARIVSFASREFEEWRESAWRTWLRAASTAPAAIPTPADNSTASSGAAATAISGAAPIGAITGAAFMAATIPLSPRSMTSEEAAVQVEPARQQVLALERQVGGPHIGPESRRSSERRASLILWGARCLRGFGMADRGCPKLNSFGKAGPSRLNHASI